MSTVYRVWAHLPPSWSGMDDVPAFIVPISQSFATKAEAEAWAAKLNPEYQIEEEDNE